MIFISQNIAKRKDYVWEYRVIIVALFGVAAFEVDVLESVTQHLRDIKGCHHPLSLSTLASCRGWLALAARTMRLRLRWMSAPGLFMTA